PAPVIDLVVLDPANPRSVIFQLDRIETHLAELPRRTADGRLSPPQQIATVMLSVLRTSEAAQIDAHLLVDTENSLMRLSEAITAAYFTHYERVEGEWEAPE
ncbi:MAG TPA: alpha-E domain-containing protein, partial [Xanthobacteraceae bacterium]|nr:alpha-E domain-containing protein [Xanthobacteraceae bacterium]